MPQSLSAAGLTANASKCHFAKPRLDSGGIWLAWENRMDPERSQGIQQMPAPETKWQVRNFFQPFQLLEGLCCRLCLHCLTTDHFSQETVPWSDEAEEAFRVVKQRLTEASALHAPDLSREFFLAADTSDYTISTCLAKTDDEVRKSLISFPSKMLIPNSDVVGHHRKACIHCFWALGRLDLWLFGRGSECYV